MFQLARPCLERSLEVVVAQKDRPGVVAGRVVVETRLEEVRPLARVQVGDSSLEGLGQVLGQVLGVPPEGGLQPSLELMQV